MSQPKQIDGCDAGAGPPSDWQAQRRIEPEIIKAPGGKERGGYPVDALQRFAPPDGSDVEQAKAGAA